MSERYKGAVLLDIDRTVHSGDVFRIAVGALATEGLITIPPIRHGPYSNITAEKVRMYRQMFKGKSSDIVAAAEPAVLRAAQKIYPFVPRIIERCHQQDLRPVVISHGPDPLIKVFARAMEVEEAHGTTLGVQDGLLDGEVTLLDKAQKTAEMLDKYGTIVAALGDNLADKPMLEAATNPLAIGLDSPYGGDLHTEIHRLGLDWPSLGYYPGEAVLYDMCPGVSEPTSITPGVAYACFPEIVDEEQILDRLGLAA